MGKHVVIRTYTPKFTGIDAIKVRDQLIEFLQKETFTQVSKDEFNVTHEKGNQWKYEINREDKSFSVSISFPVSSATITLAGASLYNQINP